MSNVIYYFSATGNSLTTAKMLAEKLGDCRLVAAASTKNDSKVIENAETVGFVFPVYYGNMPYPVREMISKMVFSADAYLYIVPTYRGHAGDVAKRMDQLLKTRGQKLSFAMGHPMPGNSFINEPQVDQAHLEHQAENVARIAEAIGRREVQDYAEASVLKQTPVDFPNNFRGIVAEDHCIGCGTCVKVCPMNNIKLEGGKACIGDDCATCLACFHWCPVEAIWMSKQENIARRSKYHHPDVELEDIAAQKNGK